MPPRRQLSVAGAERRREIVAMRTARASWAEIGERFRISPSRACQLYRAAIDAIPAEAVAEHRRDQNALGDYALSRLIAIAEDESTSARTAIEAWGVAARWARHLAQLNGADVDQRDLRRDGTVIDVRPDPADYHDAIAAKVLELQAAGQ
jgi:hypothetical protein